jgi:hypothetical protein
MNFATHSGVKRTALIANEQRADDGVVRARNYFRRGWRYIPQLLSASKRVTNF